MKNFLPGPTEVNSEILKVLSLPIIGHHTSEFEELLRQIKPKLQCLMGTENNVFIFTCTASAAMEAALANTVERKALIVSNGAFGERWLHAARSLDLSADGLIMGWGMPILEQEVRRLLDRVGYDTLVMVHGESSTGMLNPLEPISTILAERPDILFLLDAVATLGGVPISMDSAGVDVLIGASQKCLALPPGLVPVGVSERAIEKSRSSKRKGYALDFSLWKERWDENQTVATPATPQIKALDEQLKRIEEETTETRFKRHQNMSKMTLEWASNHGFKSFAPEGYALPSVSCLRPEKGGRTTGIVDKLRKLGYLIDDGYGKLKGTSIRIGHMGDWTETELEGLLNAISAAFDG